MTKPTPARFSPHAKKWGHKLTTVTFKLEPTVVDALNKLSAQQTQRAKKVISRSKIVNDSLLRDEFISQDSAVIRRLEQLNREKRNDTKESTTTS